MVVTSDMRWNKKKLADPDTIKGKSGNTKKRVTLSTLEIITVKHISIYYMFWEGPSFKTPCKKIIFIVHQ
jgi:hypothetical protein